MKKLIAICSLMLLISTSGAQDKLPSFGKIDKADLDMKDCDYDPGAEAVVLIDVGEIQFAYVQHTGWQSESNYRVRIKILKASAVNRAEIKLRYYSKSHNQDIYKVNGISYNVDASGNISETKLEDRSIFNKQIDKEFSEISFALPEVKIGTVFEYRYKMVRKSFGYIPAWTFQRDIPVRYSAYNIIIPEYFQFTVQSTRRQEIERKQDKNMNGGSWYIMRNLPGLKEEPFSSGREEYLQKVEFQLSKIDAPNYYEEIRSTWPKIIKELLEDEDFGLAIKKNLKGTGDIEAQLSRAGSTKEKVRMVYNYVQTNMQWNQEYSIYSNHGIKEAWDKKNANISDINFILIRLLRDAGVDTRPLLVSTKDNGMVNTVFPFLQQFNAVLAYVEDGDQVYIMNAADKYNPFNLVPYDVLYRNALVVDKDNGGIITLNSDKNFMNNIFFTASVSADGKIGGHATLSSFGYARNIRMNTFKKSTLKDMLEDNEGVSIKVDSLAVKHEADELKPFEQDVQFDGNLQISGEYSFLPLTLFSGLGKNPFIDEHRIMDIDFDFPKKYVISGSYILPDNFTIEELPRNIKMMMPDTSIVLVRMLQKDADNMISFRFTLDFNTPVYDADSYPYIKEFFKKLYEILDERIVLKKK